MANMTDQPVHGFDIDTKALGEYIETLGVAIQNDDVIVNDVHEDRDVPDPEEELEIRFGITFTPFGNVELNTGVPYEYPEGDK